MLTSHHALRACCLKMVVVLSTVGLLPLANPHAIQARYAVPNPDGTAWQAPVNASTRYGEQDPSNIHSTTRSNEDNADVRLVHHKEGHVRTSDIDKGGGLKGYVKRLWKKMTEPTVEPEPTSDPEPTTEPVPTSGQLPGSLAFTGVEGGPSPASQTLSVTNTGGGILTWSASATAAWLTLSPSSGTTTTETDVITVSVDTTGLFASTYSATITLTAVGATNSPQQVAVTLTVIEPPPTISHSPESLTFTGVEGGANPAAQALTMTNAGEGTLSWSASNDATWLSLSPASGTTTTETDVITASVDSDGFIAGVYTTTITLTALGATNSPQQVLATLVVTEAQSSSVTLSWNPNSESDLAGYRVYAGTVSGSYGNPVDMGNVTTFQIVNLSPGQTYHFAVTAYDSSGNESGFSNEASIN